MSTFDSLLAALEGWFDKPLCDLPGKLRQRIKQDFFPMPWDDLIHDQRRGVAQQWDYLHDPAMEKNREFWWAFYERKDAIEYQIEKWEAVSTPTAGDMTQQEERLIELRDELERLERQGEQQALKDNAGNHPFDCLGSGLEIGSPAWRKQNARHAANTRHDQPGGSRDKKQQMRDIWATGKYSTRDVCAEQECAAMDMSFAAARKALRNTPKPT